MNTSQPILPPAMLGVLGGGQLGRMFVVAAKTMGYQVTVLDPNPDAPAAAFADRHLCAPFDDEAALAELAKCAAVTTEFENVSADVMHFLADHTVVSPRGDSVSIAQNRIQEKAWIQKAGLETAPYQAVCSLDDITEASAELLPGILKTATLGYDGKGQVRVKTLDELKAAFETLNRVDCILEKMVDLRSEISVIVCRLDSDNEQTFDPAENIHEDGILAYSIVPARLSADVQQQAQDMARRLADELDYVGVLAVEMFVVGDTHSLIVNEMAPRPHNSGHHTLNACTTDQFQQQVRIMCGLPPADTRLLSSCCMANILGDVWKDNGEPNWLPIQTDLHAYLHLYGKKSAGKGRKMGHFTVLDKDAGAAFEKAQALHAKL
ncbi:5-(carboxyamino)imidazole ribonucleotide synthase [Neisseria montereyensis]|uniref:N5-carboxyaminoimidazole ribonucleotide synthase n=1 Tax=Neisseria montereyensis TaxID=2973938 RepID=A0ABT2FBZ2_9NEIS|nr:5-(carboxyamino)imidazole ribonucleotide synthase [Neisseria montereyensis]MCS4533264.1 5-(carboxyamino)imidazole ribonucleotide synthase [Neisseria montereyensis]